MRKGICFCLLMCSALLFAGCLGKLPEEDTISVDKKGRVTSTTKSVSLSRASSVKMRTLRQKKPTAM